MLKTINILGVRIHLIKKNILHQRISEIIQANRHALILNVNVHGMNLAYENPWLCRFFNQAEIVFCDGAGIIIASRLLGYIIPERITYADWMWELASIANSVGYTMYLLGAKPLAVEKAAAQLRKRFPNIKILFVQNGYFNKEPDSQENIAIVTSINSLQPNILILGMGMPMQERWLSENWGHLNVNIALTGGAVFDYISGELIRPPRWMTKNGLEWLGRLIIEPRRLWKRYIIGNPLFFWRVFIHHILGCPLPK